MKDQHAVTTVREDNDCYFRCSCGSTMSTSAGVDRHHLGVLIEDNNHLRQALADIRAILLGWIPSQSSEEIVRRIERALAVDGDDAVSKENGND